jgi:hypothetical protein
VIAATAPSDDAVFAAPAPHVQQFRKLAAGTCDAEAPKDLDWAGVAGGGWGESWAQWMNDGMGGEVCTRTLPYSPRGMWIVE